MQNHLSSVSAKLAAFNCLADNTVTVLIIVSCLHFVFPPVPEWAESCVTTYSGTISSYV